MVSQFEIETINFEASTKNSKIEGTSEKLKSLGMTENNVTFYLNGRKN